MAGLWAIGECLWHLAHLGVLILCIGCLVAPIVFGWYCVDARKEDNYGD